MAQTEFSTLTRVVSSRPPTSRPLTIAMVAPPWYTLPPEGYGGIELVVSLLARGLRERGHRVILFGAEDSAEPVVGLALKSWRGDLGNPAQGLREATYAADVQAYLLEDAGPVDLIHDHSGLVTVAAALAGRTAPVVHTVHGPLTEDLEGMVDGLARGTSLVAISASQQALAPQLPWAGVVHNAVDVDTLRPVAAEDKEDYLVVLARICEDKGQHHAIEVARRAGMRLVLAGKVDPVGQAYFDAAVAPHVDGDRVKWVSNVAGAAKTRLLARARALLAPITWPEPFGLSMVEAMVCGTPTVAFARGAAPELVDEGRSGFVVDTVDEMVDAVRQVASIDPLACAMAARRRFAPEVMVDEYLKVYQRVMAYAAPEVAIA